MKDDRSKKPGGRPGPKGPRPKGPRPQGARPKGPRIPDGPPPAETGRGERIAKRLARAGIASRRDAEALVAAGRIAVNGKVVTSPALNVGARDQITFDGNPIPEIERTRLFLFHKPAGVVTSNRDPEGRRTVFDVLPPGLPRLVTVGRLDINTEGLLLLTNDGGLSRVLELPATGWLRRYRVRVHGTVDQAALDGLREGVAVDGVFYGAVEAVLERVQGSNAWLVVGLREGKNREVRNVLGTLGLEVTRLIRVSYGPFQLGELAQGEVRELKGRHLRDQLGERLIAEAGADFDAPLLDSRAASTPKPAPKQAEAGRPRGDKPSREDKRREALDRLQTSPVRKSGKPDRPQPGGSKPGGPKFGAPKPGGPKPGGPKTGGSKFGGPKPAGAKPGGAEQQAPRSRTANVWMAPGAKPKGEKRLAADAERNDGRRYAGKPRPHGGGGRKGPDGRTPSPAGPRGPRGPRKKG
jgi:23S rRNA pseudouridine2605 synthase